MYETQNLLSTFANSQAKYLFYPNLPQALWKQYARLKKAHEIIINTQLIHSVEKQKDIFHYENVHKNRVC